MERVNATRAYMRVYKVRDANVAAVCASKLLRLAKVKKALDEGMKARLERMDFSQDKILMVMSNIIN